MPTKEYFVIRWNQGEDVNSGKFLEKVGDWFLYFDENLFHAMQFDTMELAEKVIQKYTLTEHCKIRKVQMTMELK